MSVKDQVNNPVDTVSPVIAAGQSLSGAAFCGGLRPRGIYIPSNWTTAAMYFFTSHDNTNFSEVYDGSGNEYQVAVVAGTYVLLDPDVFDYIFALQIQSGPTALPVIQTYAQSLIINLG